MLCVNNDDFAHTNMCNIQGAKPADMWQEMAQSHKEYLFETGALPVIGR